MITSTADFEEATSYERFALREMAPLVAASSAGGTIDLRTSYRHFSISVRPAEFSSARIEEVIGRFRPLGVGAALKVLDLAVEIGLGAVAPKARRTFEEKAAQATTGRLPPLSSEPAVWRSLCATYAALVEQRHCVVHRAFAVDSTGTMTAMRQQSGAAIRDLAVDEQLALISVAQRVADAVLTGTLSPRHRDDLLFHLDRLARHHGKGVSGAQQFQSVFLVLANAIPSGTDWTVDTTAMLARVQPAAPGRHFDLELHFPGLGVAPLRGELDAAPLGIQTVDPRAPPAWLRP